MKTASENLLRWGTVVLFASAMAWVESAAVFYLRTYVDRIEPYRLEPLPLIGVFGPVELLRELATMVMLFTVGVLAGRTWRARWGYAVIAFGVWDILYYAFLKLMCGWPHSFLDWDVLFLLPLPWWGPVLAPMLIALLMIGWGTLASQFESSPASRLSTLATWSIAFTGMLLALYAFMTDSIHVVGQGADAVRNVLPATFNWPLFGLALLGLAAPLGHQLWDLAKQRRTATRAGSSGSTWTSRPQLDA
jgi:hypothetical protein